MGIPALLIIRGSIFNWSLQLQYLDLTDQGLDRTNEPLQTETNKLALGIISNPYYKKSTYTWLK